VRVKQNINGKSGNDIEEVSEMTKHCSVFVRSHLHSGDNVVNQKGQLAVLAAEWHACETSPSVRGQSQITSSVQRPLGWLCT